MIKSTYQLDEDVQNLSDTVTTDLHHVILWNDDVNTFDWVIESLMDICLHEYEQAEQCAMIVHFNGKCDVKKATLPDAKKICQALLDRGLSATIS
jgi:ATP-dependent Clp protease adaptor protein ClpS